ncbi:MAG: CBS domain-containing protein [Desulfurococcales archaeon]|nr:CBS domain-containing protein [Desulfurococcales archaeon]
MVRLPKRAIPLFARDIMSTPPLVIHEKTPLREAAKLMCENKVGSVIIIGEDGKIRGILTERDITCAASRTSDVCEMPVWEFMTPDPAVVYPTTPLSEVIEKMSELGVRHLPVVDKDNKPVGVISVRDILAVIELLFRAFR